MLHVEVFSPICMVDFFLLVVFPKGFLHRRCGCMVFVSLIVVSMFVVGVGTCVKSITYYY